MTPDHTTHSSTNWPLKYRGDKLLQIGMPMGGIGTGCICLNGYGGLQDFAIYGKPAVTATHDYHNSGNAAFAVLHIKGENGVTRLVEGPFPPEKIYDQGLQALGYCKGGHEGMPRFTECEFTSEYPFGTVSLTDPSIPLQVAIVGWSPFIPLDDKNSGIPSAILDYSFTNTSGTAVEFEFSYHVSHLARGKGRETGSRNSLIPGRGVFFSNVDESTEPTFGSFALATAASDPTLKGMWFRGHWFDSISAIWRETSTGSFYANDGALSEKGLEGRNGGSLMVSRTLQPGETVKIPIVVTWYFPNSDLHVGGVGANKDSIWHPYYTTLWTDAQDAANYVIDHLDELRARTQAFQTALYASTLPHSVVDAVATNLAIIKSPTVLRESGGSLWCWEGCQAMAGSCHGSCTHVWNYAQAIPHLFPALERTLRELEYCDSMDERGHVNFRSAIPIGPTTHDFHAASDGQLGGILKLYREWQIAGDNEWLTRMYPMAKSSLDYCIETWDPEHRGGLFEPHHNTYDIEFWGPDGMCTTIYLGALAAIAEMAGALGRSDEAAFYTDLAAKSATFLDSELFNGEYYEHKVQWDGLRDTSFAEMLAGFPTDGSIDQMSALLKAEGPKYQYGIGCISDGVIGAWMSDIYGVATPLDSGNVKSHLAAIFEHNFKTDLFDHACLQRPGFAIGHEAGLLLCSWPRGGKPTLPFVYSDEVWTGIEYQVASHLIEAGLVDEGLKVVEAVRSRYEGHVRNPFNEYECGNYYARAMASYALVGALSGFRYSAVSKALRFGPKVEANPFVTFFSAASGFGTIEMDAEGLTITMVEGDLSVDTLVLNRIGSETTISVGGTARVGTPLRIAS